MVQGAQNTTEHTAVPPYLKFHFLWFQLPTVNSSLKDDDPPDIPSDGQQQT